MKPRRISSILTASAAAAVVCCNISNVESASVRGVAKRRREDNITHPQQQLDDYEEPSNTLEQQEQRRSLQHWWHGKKNDEKDIVYVNLGVPSNVNTNQLQALHDKQNDPTNAIDEGDIAYGNTNDMVQNSATTEEEGNQGGSNGGEYTSNTNMHGKSSLSVYSITTSNNPDTSNLPYRQPTKTPTPKPTQLPSTSPTSSPTNMPVETIMEQMMTNVELEEGGIYYPLWGNQFTGCTSSLNPPEVYTAATTNTQDLTSIQYLFNSKEQCCNYWFINDYNSCLELVMNIQMLNDMLIEDSTQEDESDMESYSGKKSGTSNDYGNPPPPPPPSPPVEEEEEEEGGDLIFINPDIEAAPDQEEDFSTSDVELEVGNSTSTSPVLASTPPPAPPAEGEGTSSSPSTLGTSNTPPPFPSTSNGIVIDVSTTSSSPSVVYSTSDVPAPESEVVTPPPSPAEVMSTPPPTEVMSTPSPTDPQVPIPQPAPAYTPSDIDLTTPWPTFASTMANPPTLPPVSINATESPTGPAAIDLEVGEPAVVDTPSPSATVETGDRTNSPSMVASVVSSSPTLSGTVNDTTIVTESNSIESNETKTTTTAPSSSVSSQGTTEAPTIGGTSAPIVPTTPSPTVFEGMTELTSKPTQVNSTAGGETYTPTSPWPTFSPNVKPAFEQFQEGTTSPTSFDGGEDGGSEGGATSSPSVGGTGVDDSSSSPPVEGTPPPSSAGTTSGTTLEAKLYSMSAPAATDYSNVNKIIYSQSFEDGILPLINTNSNNNEYFSWSMSGNTQWTVNEVNIADSYNIHANSEEDWGQLHAATIGGSGRYAMESVLKLSIGSSANEAYDSVLEHGAYISFGIKTNVEFPIDSLIFRVNDKIMGYWHGSNEDGWESFTTYLPPRDYDGQVQELSWTYSYFGSDDASTNHENAVQLDRLVIQATTGDLIISDTDLQNLAQDSSFIPALNLHDTSSDDDDTVAAWQIVQQASNGGHVLKADTRSIVRSNPANSQSITTYQGKASMSINIITGLFGGKLHFALLSKVHTPIDVLEIHIDDSPYMAITTSSSEWQPYSVEIPQGKHIVTFTHISNPANLPMLTLESMGQPGSSILDGLQYIDNIDPALITPVPTRSPTQEPSIAPTKYTIPPQNYCAESLSKIQETCWTVNDKPLTCNDDPSVCPQGTICWGDVDCEIPMEAMSTSWLDTTPSPSITTSHSSPSQGQNYCAPFGTSLSSIKEMCSSGLLATCNTGDDPCPLGTGCWGNIQCNPIEEELIQYSSCPEGLSSPQGLPGCCVPDPNFLGDGACDAYSPYNTAECNYDGGDCCKESCDPNSLYACAAKEGDAYGPFGFFCIDPQYAHIDEDRCLAENREWIGDGGCDPDYNTEACGWDGGDCCKETCDEKYGYYKCGRDAQPFDCRDPNIIYRADYVLGRDDS